MDEVISFCKVILDEVIISCKVTVDEVTSCCKTTVVEVTPSCRRMSRHPMTGQGLISVCFYRSISYSFIVFM